MSTIKCHVFKTEQKICIFYLQFIDLTQLCFIPISDVLYFYFVHSLTGRFHTLNKDMYLVFQSLQASDEINGLSLLFRRSVIRIKKSQNLANSNFKPCTHFNKWF